MGGMGWIMMILVGGVAGLVASRITKTKHSLIGNIVLGIIGAVLLNIVLAKGLNLHFGGLFGQFATAVLGASAIIVGVRLLRGRR